jgi:hypothetical protein
MTDKKHSSPLRRVGIILIIGSLIATAGTMIHFNVTTETFVYGQSEYKLIKKVPRPGTVEGFYWKELAYGWEMYPGHCEFPEYSYMFVVRIKPECARAKKTVRHKYKLEYSLGYAFDDYLEETYEWRGKYKTPFRFIITFFIIGLVCFKGWVAKWINWIKHG